MTEKSIGEGGGWTGKCLDFVISRSRQFMTWDGGVEGRGVTEKRSGPRSVA